MVTTNGSVANGVPSPKPDEDSPPKVRRYSALQTVFDVISFLLVSGGYIFQALYWTIFGHPLKDLRGGVAVVTGGGGGLGRLIALRLARLGCTVVLWDINQQGLDESVKLVRAIGGRCHDYIVDLANRQDIYRVAKKVGDEVGRVTLLINNAGVVSGRLFLDTPDELIQRTFDVNVLAHFWTVKAFLPSMVAESDGHIVTIASLAGLVGVPKLVDYCASKAAALGFDEALRSELEVLRVKGVNTTVICPYFIRSTGMFDDVNSRFVPTLNSNDVADRIISAIRTDEKYAIVPGYLQLMLPVKWIFPWGCVAGFLRGLVPDAVPDRHHMYSPHCNGDISSPISKDKKAAEIPGKEVNFERKP